MVRRFAGLWIPAELLQVQDLTLHEIFLAAEIDALDNPRTGCTAKNDHFMELMGLCRSRIAELISSLLGRGLIRYQTDNRKKRVLRSCLARWVAERRAESDRAIAEFTAEVDAATHELGLIEPMDEIPSKSLSPENRTNEGRDSGRTGSAILMLRDNNENTKKDSFGITPNSQPQNEHETKGITTQENDVVTNKPNTEKQPQTIATPPVSDAANVSGEKATHTHFSQKNPPKARVGRPPKTGLVTAPLFGADPAGDYGPTDDEIYWAYPRKTKRPEAIKQIVLAVRRITIDHRSKGKQFAEKSAREFLLRKVKEYAEHRKAELTHDARALEFTPYPSTWFYNERYNDDDASGPIGRIPVRRNAQRKTAEERGQFAESRDYSRIIHDTSGIDSPASGGNGQGASGPGGGESNSGGVGVPSDANGYRIGTGNAAAERIPKTENPPAHYGGIQ